MHHPSIFRSRPNMSCDYNVFVPLSLSLVCLALYRVLTPENRRQFSLRNPEATLAPNCTYAPVAVCVLAGVINSKTVIDARADLHTPVLTVSTTVCCRQDYTFLFLSLVSYTFNRYTGLCRTYISCATVFLARIV